jgi:hypothetical protein
MEPRNRFQGIDSASLCSLAGRYDNPIHTWFLAPIDCSKIPALHLWYAKNFFPVFNLVYAIAVVVSDTYTVNLVFLAVYEKNTRNCPLNKPVVRMNV